MSEELQSKYMTGGRIIGQKLGEFEYFQIGSTTFNQLKQAGLIKNIHNALYANHKPDRLIVDRRGKEPIIVAVVEDKKGGKFNSEKEKTKAIQQCNNYCQEVDAKVGIITDGSISVWINPNQKNTDTEYDDELTGERRSYSFIKKEDGSPIIRNFLVLEKQDILNINKMSDDTRKSYKLVSEISQKINSDNSTIKEPERIDPLPLARRVWQDIWVATGKSPEKCLYNVVELFIFKFLSDLEILNYPNDFNSLYTLVEKNNQPKDILKYYVNNCRKEIYNKFPSGKDGTTIINGTIFVDEKGEANITQALLFRESLKKFKDFENEFGKFSTHNIDRDFKTKLYEAFLKQTAGLKALGQFFTPRKVVRSMVQMSDIKNFTGGERFCDPFCGVGGFVLEPLNLPERANDFRPINGKITPPFIYSGYDKGFEKDEERTIILAKANMLIYLSEIIAETKLTEEFSKKAFNGTFTLWRSNLGTLGEITNKEEERFDLILTNPPYVKRGIKTLRNEIEENSELKNFYSVGGGGLEGLAVEWIIRHLKKGGRALIIVPDGILNRIEDKKLRKFILNECYLDAIVSLPQKTFYATPKKTYILAITKKRDIEDKQTFPVYTYLVSNIGETLDVNRFETPEKNDLPEMVDLFQEYKIYKTKELVFDLNSKSARCKIQPLEKFDPEKYWSVDRWWTREEKIKLGIEEEEEEITIDEFGELLQNSYSELGNILSENSEFLKKKFKSQQGLKFKTVSLSDSSYFKLSIGKRLLKRDLFLSKDNPKAIVPAFSANVFVPFGYIEKSNISSFSNPYILWGIDGNFDLNYMKQGEVFASTDHCGTIEILDKNINPEYLLINLNLKRFEYGFDRGLRSNLVNVNRVEVDIPINEDGSFNLNQQKDILLKNNQIVKLQARIEEVSRLISTPSINFSDKYEFEETELKDIFSIKQGNSFYTKKRVLGSGWKGEIPVYSSNTKDNGILMKMDLSKIKKEDLYYQQCLTWSIDGYAGTLFIRNAKNTDNEKKQEYYFTINNHCGILVPKTKNIYLPFIKQILQPIFYRKSKGYGNNKVGSNQIEDIIVKMPIDENGKFDLNMQKELTEKYEKLNQIKTELLQKLQTLITAKIVFD